jgi:hypothetical protein
MNNSTDNRSKGSDEGWGHYVTLELILPGSEGLARYD